MMHGAIYGVMKTEGTLHDKLRVWAMRCIIFFVICAVTLTMATLLYVPHMALRVRENPWLFSIALVNMLSIANIPREFHHGNDGEGVFILLRRHRDADGFIRAKHFSEPSLQPVQSRKQPDDLQRRVIVKNTWHHSHYRLYRRAGGHRIHRLHLLDFQRKS